MGPVLCK